MRKKIKAAFTQKTQGNNIAKNVLIFVYNNCVIANEGVMQYGLYMSRHRDPMHSVMPSSVYPTTTHLLYMSFYNIDNNSYIYFRKRSTSGQTFDSIAGQKHNCELSALIQRDERNKLSREHTYDFD